MKLYGSHIVGGGREGGRGGGNKVTRYLAFLFGSLVSKVCVCHAGMVS